MKKNNKWPIIIACIIVAVPLLYVPTKFAVESAHICKRKHDNLRFSKQAEIEAINKVEILPNGEPQKAHVSTHGGCDGFNPLGITIKKEYTGSVNGGEVLNSVRNSLKSAGYKFKNENFGSEGCKAIYRANATKGKVEIYVALSQNKNKITSCTDGYPTGISEETFISQTIDKALVTPKCGNENCL